jgi:uncharacterized membrane protein YphA (DoxX/SURF4 family)
MEKIKINEKIILLLRVIVGFVFVYASIHKIADPETFAKSIANYRILPIFSINIIAITVAWIELVMGLFMIFGIFIKASSFIATFLMGFFATLVLVTIVRGIDITCGCFSPSSPKPVGWQKFTENTILFIISFLVYYSKGAYLSVEQYFRMKKSE